MNTGISRTRTLSVRTLLRPIAKNAFKAAFFLAITASCSVMAQPPDMGGRGGRGDRDSDRGSDRGGRGGEEGGRSRFGMSFGGGMGGPMGGGPMGGGMGSPFGGGMGGPFGGGMGGPMGGGMGGFDPSAMLARFDRNGNKMLDPDETQGPAGFFLQRMAQSNPKIDLSKPIPLETIAGEFDRMRQERMGGEGFGGAPTEQEQTGPKPLVPTFGIPTTLGTVPGFGTQSGGETPVEVTTRDLREAEDRMGRYDRNADGFLSAEELGGGRWSDDPMQFDRNRDGKLSKEELAVRYAKRRIAEEQQAQSPDQNGRGGEQRGGRGSMMFMGGPGGMMGGPGAMMGMGEGGGDRGGDQGGQASSQDAEKARPKSLRQMTTREKIDKETGKPDWFNRDDKDADGQVAMNEFASSWDETTVVDFAKFDLNTDGFITTIEVRKAIANGATRSGGSSRGSSSTASSSRRDSRSSTETATPSASSTTPTAPSGSDSKPADAVAGAPAETSSSPAATPSPAPASSGAVDPVKLKWAEKQIGKYDKNKDGALTPNEWSEMPIPPKNEFDLDGDGRITAEEYAISRK